MILELLGLVLELAKGLRIWDRRSRPVPVAKVREHKRMDRMGQGEVLPPTSRLGTSKGEDYKRDKGIEGDVPPRDVATEIPVAR